MDVVLTADLLDFWVIIFFSFLGVALSAKLRLPSVIGLLFFGAIIGPNFLGIITETDFISLISEIGVILLLFYIGIHFNLDRISRFGLRATFVLLVKFAILFLITYLAGIFLGFQPLDAMILGVILAFSSTAIFARLVTDSGREKRVESNLMSAVLILEDVVAVFALTLLSQMQGDITLSVGQVLVSVLFSLLILFCSYLIIRWLVIRLSKWMDEKNLEAQLFSALSMCALLALVAMSFHLSPSIGAFLAGSTVAAIPSFRKIETTLKQMTLLFAAFFFFSMGMLVNMEFILGAVWTVFFLAALNMALKFFSISFSTYMTGFSGKASISAGILMLTSSEFGLIIASQTVGTTSFDFVSLSTALIVISGLAASVLMPREKGIGVLLGTKFGLDRKKNPFRHLSAYMSHVLHHFEPKGPFYKAFRSHARSLVINLVVLFLIDSLMVVIRSHVALYFGLTGYMVGPFDIFEILAFLFSVYPLYNIFRIISTLAGKFAHAFHFGPAAHANIRSKMIEDFFFFSLFMVVALSIPFAVGLLGLPAIIQEAFLLPLAAAFLFLWDLARQATRLLAPHEDRYHKLKGYKGKKSSG
ncbi:MAG: cation:proton antiporter [Candidatus Micrarchaeia archaeon]